MQHFMPEQQKTDWEKWTGSSYQISGIHVWKADLYEQAANVKKYYSSLAETEKERAERYRFVTVRQRFTIAHGMVREVLGCYLHLPPAEVEIAKLPSGKPVVAGKSINFNFSHSEDLLLLAVSKKHELGIDAEWIKPGFDHAAVSEHFFAPNERQWLQSLAPEVRGKAFFQLWTCKEAVLKAAGSGLQRNLEEVKIEFQAGEELARCKLDWGPELEDTWAVKTFIPEAGYAAALAFNQDASAAVLPDLKFFHWTR